MQFTVLGPLQVRVDGNPISPTAPILRVLLATLLSRANTAVPDDVLVDAMWSGRAVPKARQKLQVHVHRLRQALGDPARITREHGTYTLLVRPGELDAEVFETRLGAAAEAGDTRATLLRAALDLWDGAAYAELDHVPQLRTEANRLTERRLVGFEDLYAAELDRGRHGSVVAGLRELAERHPLRERLQELLMLALYRGGQQAAALEVYRQARTVLVDELGVEPGPRLSELHQSVLAADPALTPAILPSPSAPAQLPAAIADFTGRDKQLALIRDLACPEGAGTVGSTALVAIAGPAGIGKTALAVRAAHRLRADYPGGQLYVDLRGAEAVPMEPADVLARFLRGLGVAGPAIPDDLDERAALYRSLVAEARLLVLLDNAQHEEQVRPLLPAGPHSLVLVTSRTRLGGLEGAQLIDLDLFDAEQAIGLLARVAGPSRVSAEPAAAERIVELCGHLPLAVRIAAARLATRPGWSLGQLADRLADEHHRLDELRLGDLAVRASLTLSDRDLDPVARRAFRRLGLLDVPQFAAWVAAAVLDRPVAEAEAALDQLVDARLLEPTDAHYRFHDLVRLYARECAQTDESPAECHAALARAIGGWLSLARSAAEGLDQVTSDLGLLSDTWQPDEPVLPTDPIEWLETERPALVAVVDQAAAAGLPAVACELADTLTPFQDVRGYSDDWRRTHESALAAARRIGDQRSVGVMCLKLARLELTHDRFAQTWTMLDQAGHAFDAAADRHGAAQVRFFVGMTYRALGQPEQALVSLDRALAFFGELRDEHGLALVRQEIGAAYLDLRRTGEARGQLDRSLTAFRILGDRRSEALTLRWIGTTERQDGCHDQAETHLSESRAIFERLGDVHNAAYVLGDLGRLRLAQGRWPEADALIGRSLTGFRTYRDRHGEARALHDLGLLQQAQACHLAAAAYLLDAVRIWRELGVGLWQERTLRSLRDSYLASGDEAAAHAADLEAAAL